MKLADLIDIEHQLYKDQHLEPELVRSRDRRVGQRFRGDSNRREVLFLRWLRETGVDDHRSIGRSVASSFTLLRYLVFFVFLFSGIGTCANILYYDGSHPVNVVNFLAVFVGLQLVLYLVFLLNLLPNSIKKKLPLIGDIYRFIAFLSLLFLQKIQSTSFKKNHEKIMEMQRVMQRARMRHKVYQEIEKWLTFSLTQLGGFAFSLGALAMCSYLIIFSDLAFAWNTTLDIPAKMFHNIVSTLAAPWAAFAPAHVPSLELVEASRFFRLEGAYVMAEQAVQNTSLFVGGWWSFLIFSIVTYAVLPRFVFFLLSKAQLNRHLKKAPFRSADFDALYERLVTPVIETRAPISTGEPSSKETARITDMVTKKSINASVCHLIQWGEFDLENELLTSLVKNRFGWRVAQQFRAGLFDNEQDEETLERFSRSPEEEPILIIAEGWEAPGKAIQLFLKRLRMNIKDDRTIFIGLVNVKSATEYQKISMNEWRIWQENSAALGDPYVRLESLVEEK